MTTSSVRTLVQYQRVLSALSAVAMACAMMAACRATPSTSAAAITADTWAVVDGRAIARNDVEKAYRRTHDASQPLSEEEALTAKLSLLNDLILQDILVAKASTLKIDVPQSDLDAAYANASKNLPPDAYQQELARRNLTADDIRTDTRRQLLTQKVLDQEVGAKIAVTDQEIADFFTANRAQFNVAEESYHIAQIVVTPVRDPQLANSTGDDATTPQAAAAKAQMLMERLKAGASFADLAASYSEDPESAPRGGDLGLVPVSRLKQAPPPLRDAVLGKEPGAISLVTVGGAHTLLLVIAHEPAGQRNPSMPQVRQRITNTIRGRKEQLLRTAYLTAVRGDAVVVNYLARRVVDSQGKMPMPMAPMAAPAK
jgi:peptidyl-prolyl cis-trans isomerase SurA